jgi:hypothetical protein
MRKLIVVLLFAALPAHSQSNWFSEARLNQPEFRKALESLDESAIVAEWIRLTEIPAPSGQESAQASSIVRGIKHLIALAVMLTTH